jgi:23S rRNA maturation mini-RNase III
VSEYNFTTKKINQSFSNYSSWHQRSKLLPEIVVPKKTEEKNEIARRGKGPEKSYKKKRKRFNA